MEQFRLPVDQRLVPLAGCVDFDRRGGFLARRRRWSWLSQPDRVCFHDVRAGGWKGSVPCPGGRVLAVFELKVPGKAASWLCLALVRESTSQVIVWNSSLSKIVRAFHLPFRATSVAPVSGGSLKANGLFGQSIVQEFSGVIAVGCAGGRLLLVDLALGKAWAPVTAAAPRPCHVVSVRAESLSGARAKAVKSHAHLAIDLTADYIRGSRFNYYSEESDLLETYTEVSVTCVAYAPQLCGLLAGYSFGGFQIFAMSQLTLAYSCPLVVVQPPVTHFAFQEPENDPRAFVYVWVCRGPTDESSRHRLMINLYQLAFEQRTGDLTSGGIYQGLDGVVSRLEHYLSGSPSSGSSMLSCETIVRYQKSRDVSDSVSERRHDEVIADRTLATFVWQSPGGKKRQIMAAVFDLNQWYHAQMPPLVRLQQPSGCSYFVVYLVSDEEEAVLGAEPHSFSLFPSPPPVPESHLWPSALSFEVDVLTTSSLGRYTFHGIQRMVLERLCEFKATILNDPQRFLVPCLSADLLQSSGEGSTDSLSLWAQQSGLLSVCLDHGLTAILRACAQASITGGCRCNGAAILKWVEMKLDGISREVTQFAAEIVSPTNSYVDELTVSLGRRYESQLRSLCLLLRVFALHADSTQACIAQADMLMVKAANHSCTLQTVLWGLRSRILPHSTSESSSGIFFYSGRKLLQQYRQRRRDLGDDLLVDYLVDEARVMSNYPPASLQFLSQIGSSMAHHGLVLYLMCDLEEAMVKGRGLFDCYSCLFNIPASLKECVRSLWNLDRGNYQCAVSWLCRKAIDELFPWQHKQIVQLLLRAGESSLALQYLSQIKVSSRPQEVLKLCIQALTAVGNVSAAFELVRDYEEVEEHRELLCHLLLEALSSGHASQLLQLPLDSRQQETICHLLDDMGTPASLDLELKLWLQNHRSVEAVLLAQQMRGNSAMPDSLGLLEGLASGSSDLLPPVLQGMCSRELLDRMKTTVHEEVGVPQPLSKVFATARQSQFRSQADIVCAVTRRVAEVRKVFATPKAEAGFSASGLSLRPISMSSTPFLCSPLSVQRSQQMRSSRVAMRPTPFPRAAPVESSSATPSREMSHFVTHMQGFMAMISEGDRRLEFRSLDIRTPVVSRYAHSPETRMAPPTSILKTKREEGLNANARKIRFAPGLSPSPVIVAIKSPLPPPDDSDSELFYSPDDSLNRSKLDDVRGRDASFKEDEAPLDDSLVVLGARSRFRPGTKLSPYLETPPTSSIGRTESWNGKRDGEMAKDRAHGDVDKETTKPECDRDDEMPRGMGGDRVGISPESEDEEMVQESGRVSENEDEEGTGEDSNEEQEEMLEEVERDMICYDVAKEEIAKDREGKETGAMVSEDGTAEDATLVGNTLVIGQEMEVVAGSPVDQDSLLSLPLSSLPPPSSSFLSVSSHQLAPTRAPFASSSPSVATPKPVTASDMAVSPTPPVVASSWSSENFPVLETPKTRVIPQTPPSIPLLSLKKTSRKPSFFAPVSQPSSADAASASVAFSKRKPVPARAMQTRFSEVMVSVGDEREYRFSKPTQVAADSSPAATAARERRQVSEDDAEPVKPFVFSPPLLRSASKQRKMQEFARLGIRQQETGDGTKDETLLLVTPPPPDLPPPSSSSLTESARGSSSLLAAAPSQRKRLRVPKPAQPVRRSTRLLRSSKK